MEKAEFISWQFFKKLLQQHTELNLQFQYAENKWVDAAYHITEIKQAPITSVDCGGVINEWTEIIVQLWEPESEPQKSAMKVSKALSIINLAENKLLLIPSAIVKIEFGNARFETRQMFPNAITAHGENLIVDLRPDAVQCKALSKGDNCGTNDKVEECCTPVEKSKVKLINLAVAAPACTPGSGCC